MCHDFRPVNGKTVPMHADIPLIDDVIAGVQNARYLSKMDAVQGYFQMALDPATRHKTAFTCRLGKFQYTRTALGLRNIPFFFNAVLADHF